jgi:hypothetical protein
MEFEVVEEGKKTAQGLAGLMNDGDDLEEADLSERISGGAGLAVVGGAVVAGGIATANPFAAGIGVAVCCKGFSNLFGGLRTRGR